MQAKLTEGLSLAKEFHGSVQELLKKMSECEESIKDLPAPSFIVDTVSEQLQEHKVILWNILSKSPPLIFIYMCFDQKCISFVADLAEGGQWLQWEEGLSGDYRT